MQAIKTLIFPFYIFLLLSCTNLAENENKFSYFSEQFADLKVLRYQIPGFENLSLDQKKLVYYLTEAGLSGRDIMYDQNYRHNLAIRSALENVYSNYSGDRKSDDWMEFETYLKRVWFSNGIHHHYSNDKLNVQHTTDSFPLPLIIRSGISYNKKLFLNSSVTCMVDLIHPSNNIETLNAGIEFTFLRYLSLRAGYQSLFDDSSESGLTLGVGVLSNSKGNFPLGIHYTYSVWGILNDVHRFSIDWSIAN